MISISLYKIVASILHGESYCINSLEEYKLSNIRLVPFTNIQDATAKYLFMNASCTKHSFFYIVL